MTPLQFGPKSTALVLIDLQNSRVRTAEEVLAALSQ
jgi:hypothetical protein